MVFLQRSLTRVSAPGVGVERRARVAPWTLAAVLSTIGRLPVSVALLAQMACSAELASPDLARGQIDNLAGVYVLIDSAGLVADGGRSLLRLSPGASDGVRAYQWSVFARGSDAGGGDLGTWAMNDSRVEFRSLNGNGRYSSIVQRSPGAAAAPILVVPSLLQNAARYSFLRVRATGDEVAYLSVAVVDTAGALVAGGSAVITAPDGVSETVGFAGFQPFVTTGPPGEWSVIVSPAAGYGIAPGQPNPVRVLVRAGTIPTELKVRVTRTDGR